MFFEGINFNREWVAGKTFKEFKEHEQHHGLTEQQLREVYDLCKQKPKVSKQPADEKE